jgi:hypothetical protein
MRRTDVRLCFKGDRTYLHGTDVYEAAVERLRAEWPGLDGRCRFLFHRLARRPLAALVDRFAPGVARPNGCAAEMHVTGGPVEASVWFVERDGAVDCRHPYDEDAVVRGVTLSANEISLAEPPPNRAIEVVVALTKRLHYAALAPAAGRWLFVRLDLRRLLRPGDARGVAVRLAGPARAALTRSEIVVRGEPLGSIYFSVGAA